MAKSTPGVREGGLISRLRTAGKTAENGPYYRIALDAFRQGGFLQVLSDRIGRLGLDGPGAEHLARARDEAQTAIGRRALRSPRDPLEAAGRFHEEMESMYAIHETLLEARDAVSRPARGGRDVSPGWRHPGLGAICDGFAAALNRITDGDLPYVVRRGDPLFEAHGTILLESQGLKIQVGALSDRIGLHTAWVGPRKSFGHVHSGELSPHPNWEYHFVFPGQDGSHVVGGYRCRMDADNGDIVAVSVETPHGGFNHGDAPLELHFCAGGLTPWDFPPRDLAPHDVSGSVEANDLKMVNGMPLDSVLRDLQPGIHTLIDPRGFGGRYGIELGCVVTGVEGAEFMSPGEVVQVWSGDGFLEVAGTAMRSPISAGDKCALLPETAYRVVPSRPLILLRFAMKDFN